MNQMLTTSKFFEEIVSMLNNFRSEVQTFSALGLTGINKQSENFIMRILNVAYSYELINLNKEKTNFPGLDLGDEGEGVAFQITATKSSDKVDDTLSTCIKYKHYQTFKQINIFILTKKQTSYTLKTVTEPNFPFSPESNILDINDLLKKVEHLGLSQMKALHNYIKLEVQGVIESIRENKPNEEKVILDIDASLYESKMTAYSFWRSNVAIKTETVSVPTIYNKLDTFLLHPALRSQCLPMFNEAIRQSQSNKQIQYQQRLQTTCAANCFYGQAMLLESSSISIEKADYTNGDILTNLKVEMISLLTSILFFSKLAKGNFEIEVTIKMKTNAVVYFLPTDSLFPTELFHNYTLDSPFTFTKTITNIHSSTLVDLLQEIMHAFINNETRLRIGAPFITIPQDQTKHVINVLKSTLCINDYSI